MNLCHVRVIDLHLPLDHVALAAQLAIQAQHPMQAAMQLDHILATEPETSRVQINDQNPFPYLVSFVERAGERDEVVYLGRNGRKVTHW